MSIVMLFIGLQACNQEQVEPQQIVSKPKEVDVAKADLRLDNWMEFVNDDVRLSRLNIPGTHNSGALHDLPTIFASGTAKCQDLTIKEQLEIGVRYLDIRCRHIDNVFTIHHGRVYQKQNFGDVLNTCYSFLARHPSETIIMSVKREHTSENNTRSFVETFNERYLSRRPSRWYLGDTIPALGDVRGKIVLLRRFGGTNDGINASSGWKDNTTSFIDRSDASILVQDFYRHEGDRNDAEVKKNAFTQAISQYRSLFSESSSEYDDLLFINFSSGYYVRRITGVPEYPEFAKDMNPFLWGVLASYLLQPESSPLPGITVMDFVPSYVTSGIVRTNFN